jgi:hypothetical protein
MRDKAALIRGKRGLARPGRFCNGPLQNWLSDDRSPFEPSRSHEIKCETHHNGTFGDES